MGKNPRLKHISFFWFLEIVKHACVKIGVYSHVKKYVFFSKRGHGHQMIFDPDFSKNISKATVPSKFHSLQQLRE